MLIFVYECPKQKCSEECWYFASGIILQMLTNFDIYKQH